MGGRGPGQRPPRRGRQDGSQSLGQRMVSAALRLAKMQSRQDRQVWQEQSCQEQKEQAGRDPELQFSCIPGVGTFSGSQPLEQTRKKERSHQMGGAEAGGRGCQWWEWGTCGWAPHPATFCANFLSSSTNSYLHTPSGRRGSRKSQRL